MENLEINDRLFIRIDSGTQGTKGVVLSERKKKVIAQASYSYGLIENDRGGREQDPRIWIEACKTVLKEMLANSKTIPQDVQAIGSGTFYLQYVRQLRSLIQEMDVMQMILRSLTLPPYSWQRNESLLALIFWEQLFSLVVRLPHVMPTAQVHAPSQSDPNHHRRLQHMN